MQSLPLRAIALLATLAALAPALAATAWADTGRDSHRTAGIPSTENGGTAAGRPLAVEGSGGVVGPAAKERPRAAQQPAREQPRQLEEPPAGGEETPSDNTGEEPGTAATETPDESAQAPAGAGAGSGSGSGG